MQMPQLIGLVTKSSNERKETALAQALREALALKVLKAMSEQADDLAQKSLSLRG